MANLDFLPFTDGQLITAGKLNSLVSAIQDGSIYAPGNVVGDLVTALSSRVTALESQVSALILVQAKQRQIEDFTLTAGQQVVTLEKPPTVDGELVFINGILQYKNDIINVQTHDYTISGRVITLDISRSVHVVDGDKMLVSYEYVVGA